MKKSIKAILSVVLILVLGSTVFTACGTKHKHEFSEAWTYDETGHWHACTGENCDETEGFETHVYDNDADATCNVCGFERVVQSVKTYTITFVTNGGSPVAQIEAEAGEDISVPADPTKDGYKFVGWYESSDGGVTLGDTAYQLSSVMPKKNITLYAKWKKLSVVGSWETYQVVIIEDNTSKTLNVGDVEEGLTLSKSYSTMTCGENGTLYFVAGMGGAAADSIYTEENGEYFATLTLMGDTNTIKFTYDAEKDRIECVIGEDGTPGESGYMKFMIIYTREDNAVPDTYTVMFSTGGGSAVAPITKASGKAISAPTDPTKNGYKFLGWYESSDGGVTLDDTAFVFSYMPGKDVTLYAKWQDAVIGSWQTYQIILPPQTEGDPETVYKLGDKCNFPMENTTLAQNTYNLTVSDTNISLAMLGGALNGSGTYTKTDGVYKADIAVAYGGGTETFKTQTTYDAANDRLLCNIVYYEDETITLYYTLILTRVNG